MFPLEIYKKTNQDRRAFIRTTKMNQIIILKVGLEKVKLGLGQVNSQAIFLKAIKV